ncbi:hypothetical protein NUW54_g5364 [Trametes sanguinea]|uniref:Uncharacterized protein n=1 Tax=Trametes sanguinea TaxID=158606 RepID=A0ACC1PWC5_9APHY|nr:hypothetical protein NUW54_g5364 [Trametes sanguinea]
MLCRRFGQLKTANGWARNDGQGRPGTPWAEGHRARARMIARYFRCSVMHGPTNCVGAKQWVLGRRALVLAQEPLLEPKAYDSAPPVAGWYLDEAEGADGPTLAIHPDADELQSWTLPRYWAEGYVEDNVAIGAG